MLCKRYFQLKVFKFSIGMPKYVKYNDRLCLNVKQNIFYCRYTLYQRFLSYLVNLLIYITSSFNLFFRKNQSN